MYQEVRENPGPNRVNEKWIPGFGSFTPGTYVALGKIPPKSFSYFNYNTSIIICTLQGFCKDGQKSCNKNVVNFEV